MTNHAPQIVIIGGGIAGLATAYYLQQQAQAQNLPLTYTLVERDSSFGGKIATNTDDGFVIEGGPDSFITQKPWGYQLCRELGLGDRLIGTNDERRKTFIVHKNRLRALPDGVMLIIPTRFMPFALSPLISPWGKLRMGMDFFIPPKMDDSDESLSNFITRRLGHEALDKIAEPLMAGIYVADPEHLSIQSTFPRFITMEQKYGSLIKGMLAQMKAGKASSNGTARPKLPLFMTLRGGLMELVDTLVGKLTGNLITGQGVSQIGFQPNDPLSYQIQLDNGQTLSASHVIMAIPAYSAANLLESHSSGLAEKLKSIRYISTATVSLAFKRDEIGHPLDGFGFVVPKSEDCRLMACTWVSTKFNHRAPDDRALLRVFVGGYKRQELVDLPDDELLELVKTELHRTMGVTASPIRQKIYRWPKGNAQYDVGHLDRVAEIESLAAKVLPGLYFTGSAFRGVGIPDCIHQGQQTAEQLIKSVQKKSTDGHRLTQIILKLEKS